MVMNRRQLIRNLSFFAGGTCVLSAIGCDKNGGGKTGPQNDPDGTEEIKEEKYQYPGVPKSEYYEVTVIQGETRQKITVFQSTCPEYEPGYRDMIDVDKFPLEIFKGRSISWADFSFSGNVTVIVKVINPSAITLNNNVKILPSRHELTPYVDGNTISFDLYNPGQFSVEIGSEGYKNGLMIFANPAETDIPDPSSEHYYVQEESDHSGINAIPTNYSGIYFKNGIHNIGVYDLPDNIKNIYLEEGSWVYGTFRMDGKWGVKIWGRGVLSSAKLDYRESHAIEATDSSNITVEGIVIADYTHFAVRLISANDTVKWVKIIGGWTYNCDGIRPGPNSIVSNCFIWANDDAIKPYRDNITFTDCVCWLLNNGGVIQMSWGWGNSTNVILRRIDILHAEWNREGPNTGVLNCVGDRFADGDRFGQQRNWLLEDIVTENPVPIVIGINPNPASPNIIEGMKFKDWNVRMDFSSGFRNHIVCHDPDNKYSGLEFNNFRFNDVLLTESNWISTGRFVIENIEPPVFKYATAVTD